MRVLVTGSRSWTNAPYIRHVLNETFRGRPDKANEFVLIHGACPRGADFIADQWAKDYGCVGNPIRIEVHPAQWGMDGRSAGIRRNVEMVKAGADLCLAFIRSNSRGASHCASEARKAGIPVEAHSWEKAMDCDWAITEADLIGLQLAPMELCEVCQEPTETPPLCARCDVAQDAAYERGQDV